MTQFIPYFIASYVLIFFCGYVWAKEGYKAKQEEIHVAQRKFRTYDREGRIGQ